MQRSLFDTGLKRTNTVNDTPNLNPKRNCPLPPTAKSEDVETGNVKEAKGRSERLSTVKKWNWMVSIR